VSILNDQDLSVLDYFWLHNWIGLKFVSATIFGFPAEQILKAGFCLWLARIG
jgi:hypothetical protein